MVLNKTVEDNAYFAFRKSQMKAMHTERLGVIHVSDLIKPCMRNVMYGKNTPDEYKTMDTENMKSLYFGQILHSASDVAEEDKHEMFLAYDYVKDKPVDLKKLKLKPDDPKWYDIIIGTIDDLVTVGDDVIICDKKTTGSIDYFKKYGKVSEGHVEQINKYAVLLEKCKGIKATKGCVIYISNSMVKDTYDKPVISLFELDDVEKTYKEMVINSMIIKDAMINDNKPNRTKCFLCDGMCPYATFCFDDD